MGHMPFEATQPYENDFWKKNNLNCIQASVKNINGQKKYLEFSNGEHFSYDKLVFATGSKPNKFGWPGQDLDGVMGMYHKQDLENLEKHAPNNQVCKRAVIVGGGLIGIELAEMLNSRNIPVTFLVREASFWNGVLPTAESEMINRHIINNHIDLRLNTNLKEIKSDENGCVKSVIIEETGEEITCNVVGLTTGVAPNIDFLKNSNIETNKGILVNRFLETTIKDVYAIGDCAEQREPIGNRRPIEAVWYTGRMMGETLAQTICGNRIEYHPGHWFNSAKFFDIEYQTYGWVWAKPKECKHIFTVTKQSKNQLLRLSYHPETEILQGVNVMGIRMRHKIFEQWLDQNKTLEEVIDRLQEAYFDPEFSKNPIAKIKADFAIIKQ